jgi:hypothetical protein
LLPLFEIREPLAAAKFPFAAFDTSITPLPVASLCRLSSQMLYPFARLFRHPSVQISLKLSRLFRPALIIAANGALLGPACSPVHPPSSVCE